ncbi:hypothetical protein WR25_26142 isoform L [Diploscapter pachys]|uniref:CRIB domain-containing protein n=1 Tax=Diploscapter pachys TaxID=2018661 RepID=A0A2A2J5L2_9BILA|nr:hypothetical protein WR25_26142 isoform L [Diploscapter pachys]
MFDKTPIPPPRRKRKEKLAKLHISPPKDFRHCAHIGPNDVNFNEQGEKMLQKKPVAPTVHQMGSKTIAPTPTSEFFYEHEGYEKPSSMQKFIVSAPSGTVKSSSLDASIPVKKNEEARTHEASAIHHYENQPTKHHYVNQQQRKEKFNSTPRLSNKTHAAPPPPSMKTPVETHQPNGSSDHQEVVVVMRQASTSSTTTIERLDPPVINAPGRIERPSSELLNAVERPNQLGGMMKLRLDDPIPIAGGPSSKYRSSSVAAQSVSPNRGLTPATLVPVIPELPQYEVTKSKSSAAPNSNSSEYSVVNPEANQHPPKYQSQNRDQPDTVNLTIQGSEILSELIDWLDSMTEAERKRVSDICFATTGKRNFPNDRQFIHDLKARIERERREEGLTTVSGVSNNNNNYMHQAPLPPNMLLQQSDQPAKNVYENMSSSVSSAKNSQNPPIPNSNGNGPKNPTNKLPMPKPRTKVTSNSPNASPQNNRRKKDHHFRPTRRISVDTPLEPLVESEFEHMSRKSISDENEVICWSFF